jgi:hypothetical protein
VLEQSSGDGTIRFDVSTFGADGNTTDRFAE